MFEPADPVTTAPPPPPPRGSGAKTGIVIAVLILLAGACVYLFVQTRDLRADLDKTQDSLAAEIASLKETSAITAESSHRTVEKLRDQLEAARRQASMAAGQAKTDALKNIEETRRKLEAAQALQAQQMNSQISEVKQTTDTKFSAVGTEVSGVKSDVASTKSELEKTIADLKRTTGDVDGQGVLIATNGKELAAPPYPSSVAIVNATVKCAVPEISLPSSSLMFKALHHWSETGLPPITPRTRLERLLRAHSDSVPSAKQKLGPPDET